MAYRLPTNLESLIPPPAEQVQQRRPWQGVLTLTFMNAAQGADVYVTAAETDGERYTLNISKLFRRDSLDCVSRMDLWPRRFYVYLGARRTPHDDIKAWVKRYAPPICSLMADKLPDPAANALNHANFANLSRMLLDNQIVSHSACFEASMSNLLTLHAAGAGALGSRQPARCWNDDLSDGLVFVSSCWSNFLVWTFP
jgi:hypothetical protein